MRLSNGRLSGAEREVLEWWAGMDPAGQAEKAPTKLVQEMQEFIRRPSPEEAADVFIATVVWFWQNGWSLATYVRRKMAVNRSRKWRRLPDGHFQHIEESA